MKFLIAFFIFCSSVWGAPPQASSEFADASLKHEFLLSILFKGEMFPIIISTPESKISGTLPPVIDIVVPSTASQVRHFIQDKVYLVLIPTMCLALRLVVFPAICRALRQMVANDANIDMDSCLTLNDLKEEFYWLPGSVEGPCMTGCLFVTMDLMKGLVYKLPEMLLGILSFQNKPLSDHQKKWYRIHILGSILNDPSVNPLHFRVNVEHFKPLLRFLTVEVCQNAASHAALGRADRSSADASTDDQSSYYRNLKKFTFFSSTRRDKVVTLALSKKGPIHDLALHDTISIPKFTEPNHMRCFVKKWWAYQCLLLLCVAFYELPPFIYPMMSLGLEFTFINNHLKVCLYIASAVAYQVANLLEHTFTKMQSIDWLHPRSLEMSGLVYAVLPGIVVVFIVVEKFILKEFEKILHHIKPLSSIEEIAIMNYYKEAVVNYINVCSDNPNINHLRDLRPLNLGVVISADDFECAVKAVKQLKESGFRLHGIHRQHDGFLGLQEPQAHED